MFVELPKDPLVRKHDWRIVMGRFDETLKPALGFEAKMIHVKIFASLTVILILVAYMVAIKPKSTL